MPCSGARKYRLEKILNPSPPAPPTLLTRTCTIDCRNAVAEKEDESEKNANSLLACVLHASVCVCVVVVSAGDYRHSQLCWELTKCYQKRFFQRLMLLSTDLAQRVCLCFLLQKKDVSDWGFERRFNEDNLTYTLSAK